MAGLGESPDPGTAIDRTCVAGDLSAHAGLHAAIVAGLLWAVALDMWVRPPDVVFRLPMM